MRVCVRERERERERDKERKTNKMRMTINKANNLIRLEKFRKNKILSISSITQRQKIKTFAVEQF